MKTRVIKIIRTLTLIMLFVSCGKEEITHYKDLIGEWKFSGSAFSGEFKISKSLNGNYAIEAGAAFKIMEIFTKQLTGMIWLCKEVYR